uniref:PDZ domain-containing protein n=1 Tax=Astyanax mexicanus TaxID=7994 RepID=A0A3B1IQI9_ASTMX
INGNQSEAPLEMGFHQFAIFNSSVHGPGPILVKSILPRGAAVKDGRLQSGDRILEVRITLLKVKLNRFQLLLLQKTAYLSLTEICVSTTGQWSGHNGPFTGRAGEHLRVAASSMWTLIVTLSDITFIIYTYSAVKKCLPTYRFQVFVFFVILTCFRLSN